MDFMENISKLDSDDWEKSVPAIEETLKKELQGVGGFIRLIKSESDAKKKRKVKKLITSFSTVDLCELDEKTNDFTNELLKINDKSNITLQYDLIQTILNHEKISDFENLSIAKTEIIKNNLSSLISMRLTAILYKISNQSLSQSNKSNAGQAGENFVSAILTSVGLIANTHYREQYKSQSGSDTDFAFPYVEDYNDSQLEVLVAVQMSTNDRARLTSSELKQGVIGYVVTGNGLDASSKKLKDIGSQIISSYEKNNVRIVCYVQEINYEIRRIENQLSITPDNQEYVCRLRYFKNNVLTFADFASKMKKYSYL